MKQTWQSKELDWLLIRDGYIFIMKCFPSISLANSSCFEVGVHFLLSCFLKLNISVIHSFTFA